MARRCWLLAAACPAAASPAARGEEAVALVQVALHAQRQPQGWPAYGPPQAPPWQPQGYPPPWSQYPQGAYPVQYQLASPWQPYVGPPLQQYPAAPGPQFSQPMPWGAAPVMPQTQPWLGPAQQQQQQQALRPQPPPSAPSASAQLALRAVAPAAAAPPPGAAAQAPPAAPAEEPEPARGEAARPQPPADDAGEAPMTQEQAPFYFQPDSKMACIQGPEDYIRATLEKLKNSPLGSMYAMANVTSGYCQDLDFPTWRTEECFPGAALFLASARGSRELLLAAEAQEARRYAERHGLELSHVVGKLKDMCQSATAGLMPVKLVQEQLGLSETRQPVYHFRPDNGMVCFEGPPFYVSMALDRLRRAEPVASNYAQAKVQEGSCPLVMYRRGPFASSCFPGGSAYLDEQEPHWSSVIAFDRKLARHFSAAHNISYSAALAHLDSPCDDGSLDEDRYRERRGLPAATPPLRDPQPMAYIVPDNSMACIQGTAKYMAQTLKKIKDSVVSQLFNQTSEPVPGFCRDAGYHVGGGVSLAAGVGLAKSRCFPEAHLFWDEDPAHHRLTSTAEKELIGDRLDQVLLLCSLRSEAIFEPPFAVFFDA